MLASLKGKAPKKRGGLTDLEPLRCALIYAHVSVPSSFAPQVFVASLLCRLGAGNSFINVTDTALASVALMT